MGESRPEGKLEGNSTFPNHELSVDSNTAFLPRGVSYWLGGCSLLYTDHIDIICPENLSASKMESLCFSILLGNKCLVEHSRRSMWVGNIFCFTARCLKCSIVVVTREKQSYPAFYLRICSVLIFWGKKYVPLIDLFNKTFYQASELLTSCLFSSLKNSLAWPKILITFSTNDWQLTATSNQKTSGPQDCRQLASASHSHHGTAL